MRVTFTKADLTAATTAVLPAIPNRPDQPILRGIRIQATSDVARLDAFDRTTHIATSTYCEVDEPGIALVAGRLLTNIVAALPEKPITLTNDGAKLHVDAGASHFELPAMNIDDYPPLPDTPTTVGTIDGETLTASILAASGAASTDDSLPMLTGLKLEATEGDLTIAATDRFRLAARSTAWSGRTIEALVPAKSIAHLVKHAEGIVDILLEQGRFGLRVGDTTVVTRLIDAGFPKWRPLLPKTASTILQVGRADLASAVKRVNLVNSGDPRVVLDISEQGLTVRAHSSEAGVASEEVDCSAQGATITIAFNADYLTKAINGFSSDRVTIAASDPRRPVTVRAAVSLEEDGDGWVLPDSDVTLLMPIHLNG